MLWWSPWATAPLFTKSESPIGQVAISHLALTYGVETRRAADFRRKKILGQRAPIRGFPSFDSGAEDEGFVIPFTKR